MASVHKLRVVLVKPSKYTVRGWVERFRWGVMPNSTLPYMKSLTPARLGETEIEVHAVDEYVQVDLDYLELLRAPAGSRTLVALVGVQSHQLHRALDLAALARSRYGALAVLGGPHPMTCDTSMLHGRGVSFAQAEAEVVWEQILTDAIERGELDDVYGGESRWQAELTPVVVQPPSRRDLRRYAARMLGLYPARGCPYRCNFCSIVKVAGHLSRSHPIDTTIQSLEAAKAGGVRAIFFSTDNFNKYPEVWELLEAMIEKRIELPFFVQCDLQIGRQERLVELLARAGCYHMFLGAESFDRKTLREAQKDQNHPKSYGDIVRLCRSHGIATTFANIIGFPRDTEQSVLEHLEILRATGPDMASFYILTPLPGTEQYDDFLSRGLISERNLDRFDASCLTWDHPRLSGGELGELIYRCYREFYSLGNAMRKSVRVLRRANHVTRGALFTGVVGDSIYSRFAGRRRRALFRERESDPRVEFSGGIGRRHVDRASDYLRLRRDFFGFDYAPLPQSLELSERDQELNRRATALAPRTPPRRVSAST